MVICSFFAQGRCRFGDKCWNEHPRDGGGGRHQYQYHAHQRYQQQHQQQPPANYGGGRGSWVPPPKYVQPSSFSKSTTWSNRDSGRAAFGSFPGSGTEDDRGRNLKSTGASAFNTSQNRFSALGSHEQLGGDAQTDEEGNVFDIIMADMEIWESSGQWLFSVYSVLKEKRNISGFTDLSQEELRLEYYASQTEGNLQNYVNSVQQLVSQWKLRLHELKNLNTTSKAKLLNELNSAFNDMVPAYGGLQQSAIGSSSFSTNTGATTAATFSFTQDTGFAQTSGAPSVPTNTSFASFPAFGTKSTSTAGLGSTTAPTAASFSFAASTAPGFGASQFSGFGSTSTAPSYGASNSTSMATGVSGTSSTTVAPGFGVSSSSGAVPGFGVSSSGVVPGFGVSSSGVVPGFGVSSSSGVVPGFGVSTSSGVVPGFGVSTSSGVVPGFGAVSSVPPAFGVKTTTVADLFKPGPVSSSSASSILGPPPGGPLSGTGSNTPLGAPAADSTSSSLFTPRTELSAEDLMQFEAKMFTLGKIPIHPPPADLII
ncbi:nucleoporin NUP42 [Ascaphus truei]|uniref:nucleoporin NUP42 n=1 Tax=Ascaphus truei TaxID=8439 RepID=UPI003F59F140